MAAARPRSLVAFTSGALILRRPTRRVTKSKLALSPLNHTTMPRLSVSMSRISSTPMKTKTHMSFISPHVLEQLLPGPAPVPALPGFFPGAPLDLTIASERLGATPTDRQVCL